MTCKIVNISERLEYKLEIYLDNSATTSVCPKAAEAAEKAFVECYGNPSAVHAMGVKAKTLLESSRAKIASVFLCSPEEVFFSHSGTLANNTAIFGTVNAKKKQGNRIVTTSVEHPSVFRCMDELENMGFEVIRLAPSNNGSFSPDELIKAVNQNTILVSTMLVNNETGAINSVELVKQAIKRVNAPALVHIDAIQGFGKIAVKPAKLGADLVTISGHKVHAPKGVGALYIKKGVTIKPYVLGGGQENNMFSGTEPLPAIAGFGAAAEFLPDLRQEFDRVSHLKARALDMLSETPSVKINSPKNGLPHIINMSVTGIPSQVLINYLSAKNIYVSAGSACKRGHRSDVLTKMGLPPQLIDSAIRVSMSRFTTLQEIEIFCKTVNAATKEIRTKL